MNIKNFIVLACSILILQVLGTNAAFSKNAEESTKCNQIDGKVKKVHVTINSYETLHLAVNRNHVTKKTTHDGQVWLRGEVSNKPDIGRKVLVFWTFKEEKAAKDSFPKCREVEDGSIKITIPYAYWQIPLLMRLLSTFPASGIVCHYESDADKTNSNARCFQNIRVD